jgi:hypothetical protein
MPGVAAIAEFASDNPTFGLGAVRQNFMECTEKRLIAFSRVERSDRENKRCFAIPRSN